MTKLMLPLPISAYVIFGPEYKQQTPVYKYCTIFLVSPTSYNGC